MPGWLTLNVFGRLLFDAFGEQPYLVGTAAHGKEWRDVDVRVMLNARAWRRVTGGESEGLTNAYPFGSRRRALELAFSTLGRDMTGLPIDFQLQTLRHANRWYRKRARVSLGVSVEHRPA